MRNWERSVLLKLEGLFYSFIYLFIGHIMWHEGLSSLTRDQLKHSALGAWSLNHWTTREVPGLE